MNAWNRTIFISALAMALVAFGCGDDGTPTDAGGDTGGGGDSSMGDGGGDSAMGDGGGTCRMPGDYYMGMDNCANTDDMAAAAREDFGAMGDQSLADLAGTCGRSCISDPNLATCTTACIVEMSEMAVSTACASCYTASVACSAENCLVECLDPSNMEACDMCRAGMNACSLNCTMEFYDCSGLPMEP